MHSTFVCLHCDVGSLYLGGAFDGNGNKFNVYSSTWAIL